MEHPVYKLDGATAGLALSALREVCLFRGWELLAAHVRTTHVHAVVDRIDQPNRAIADLKAYISRALNQLEGPRRRWSREGSTRSLRSDSAVQSAVRYVADKQGEPMAVYVLRQELLSPP